MNKKNTILALAAIVIAAAVLAVVTRNKTDQTQNEQAKETADTKRPRSASARNRSNNRSSQNKRSARTIRSVKEASSILNPAERSKALLDYFDSLSPQQLIAEFESLDSLNEHEASKLATFISETLASKNPELALQLAKEGTLPNLFDSRAFISTWANSDVTALAASYESNPDLFTGQNGFKLGRLNNLMRAAMPAYLDKDPTEALLWYNKHFDPRGGVFAGIIDPVELIANHLLNKDSATAANFITALPEGENKNRTLETFAQQWGKKNPRQAFAWAETLDASSRNIIMGSLLRGIAKTNPDYATELIGSVDNPTQQQQALGAISHEISRKDPVKALDFIKANQHIPSSKSDAEFIGRIASRENAAKVIDNYPEGELRDNFIAGYLKGRDHKRDTPQADLEAARSVTDPTKRINALAEVFAKMIAQNKAQGEALLENTDTIDDATKASVRLRITELPPKGIHLRLDQ